MREQIRKEYEQEFAEKLAKSVKDIASDIHSEIYSDFRNEFGENHVGTEYISNANYDGAIKQAVVNNLDMGRAVQQYESSLSMDDFNALGGLQVQSLDFNPFADVKVETQKNEVIEQSSVSVDMLAAAQESSGIFGAIHEQKEQEQLAKPVQAFESNIAKYSTLSPKDDRLSVRAMHEHMIEKENSIHGEMKADLAPKDGPQFFDLRKAESVHNYYDHTRPTQNSDFALGNTAEYRAKHPERGDAAYSEALKTMKLEHGKELDMARAKNPKAIDMLESKHVFQEKDFNLRDKSFKNEHPANGEKPTPITTSERKEWLDAYKDFSEKKDTYLGVAKESTVETRKANRLESNFESNYYNMLGKSEKQDMTFGIKDKNVAKIVDRNLANVMDIDKVKAHNSFRDHTANQLGGTWKHEYKSVETAKTVQATESNQVQSRNSRQSGMKMSDLSPALQKLVIKQDEKFASETGAKRRFTEMAVDPTGNSRGIAPRPEQSKAMQAVMGNTNKGQSTQQSAAMQAVKQQAKGQDATLDISKRKKELGLSM